MPLAVNRQDGFDKSVLEHYRRLIAFRQAHPAMVKGAIRFLATHDPAIVAFERSWGNEHILCVFNLSAEPVRLPLDIKGSPRAFDAEGELSGLAGGKLSLRAYETWFARLDR
jgi:alpha-glucosidase